MEYMVYMLLAFMAIMVIIPIVFYRMVWGKKKQQYLTELLDAGEISFGYKEMPDDPRLQEHAAVFELQDVLVDRLNKNMAIDEQFEMAKFALQPGNTVKLVFDIFVVAEFGTWKETVVAEEALWVLIERREEPLFYGTLASEPQELETSLKPGQKLWFHGNHILEIG